MPATRVTDKLINWASDIENDTLLQAAKTSRLPIVEGHVALMPDAHVGMGSTVGSVVPTKGAVIPSCVGVDIGCGMIAVETNLRAVDLPNLDPFLSVVERVVPAGVGQGHEHVSNRASTWLRDNKPASTFDYKQARKAAVQFGTLGSGNHFAEVCLDEKDNVWLVLHSGSRGIGNELAGGHIKKAKKLAKDLELRLEDPNLSYFLEGTPEFQHYITDMLWAQDYALQNREAMMTAFLGSFFKHVGHGRELKRINCHHNFTELERFCSTCRDIGSQDNVGLVHAPRRDEKLSTVQGFLDDCLIGFHSCGGLVLSSPRGDQASLPSLADALARSLTALPADDLASVPGYNPAASPVRPCNCRRSQIATTTFFRNLENTSSVLASLPLDEIQKEIDKPDRSQGSSSVVSPYISIGNCGGTIEGHVTQDLWITRKGAIKADIDDWGIIPGSMGTRSYIVQGKGSPLSWNSCSHGAGRRMSRSAAKKQFTTGDLEKLMEGKTWLRSKAGDLIDEIPASYKDIDAVMADQTDLVEIKHTLRQVLNYKGT